MSFPKYKNKHLEEALFGPQDIFNYKKIKEKIPKKWIIIYQNHALNYIRIKYKPKKISPEIVSNNAKIFIYKNIGFVKMSGIGCPHAVTVFEELIALGGKEFLNIGTAGGLQHEGIFLCNKALRDEGTSYHYIPHGNYSYPNEKLKKKLGKFIDKEGLEYEEAVTWTIDAPYRETKEEVKKYKKQGIATVEMEASALFAVGKLRKVKIASAFVVSDILGEKWEPKFHAFNVKRALHKLIDAGVECLKTK